jgi:hypothetical protein
VDAARCIVRTFVRLFQWVYFRSTGAIWSPSMAALCMRPTLRWAFTGRDCDVGGPTLADSIAESMRAAEVEHLREVVDMLEERHELEIEFIREIGEAIGEQEGEDVLTAAERVSRELAGARETIGHLRDEIELARRGAT